MTLLDSQDNDTNLSINFKPAFGVELSGMTTASELHPSNTIGCRSMTAMTQGDPRLNVIVNFLKNSLEVP